MFVDRTGKGVRAEGCLDTSNETVCRWRDLMILQMDRKGLTVREIAGVLNLPKSTVHYRLRTIPADARDYYEGQIRRMESA